MQNNSRLTIDDKLLKKAVLFGVGIYAFLFMASYITKYMIQSKAANPAAHFAMVPTSVTVNRDQDANFTITFNIAGQKVTAAELYFDYNPEFVEYYKEYSTGSGFTEIKDPGKENFFDVPIIEEVSAPTATSKRLRLVVVSKFNDPANPGWLTNVTGNLKFRAKKAGNTTITVNKTQTTLAGLTSAGEATYFDLPASEIQAAITISGAGGQTPTATPTPPTGATATPTPPIGATTAPTATPTLPLNPTATPTDSPITPICHPDKDSGWAECRYGQSTYNTQACRNKAAAYKGVAGPAGGDDTAWFEWSMNPPEPMSCGTACGIAPSYCIDPNRPTSTPAPNAPTATATPGGAGALNICNFLETNGTNTDDKYDLVFLPEGYTDYSKFEKDAEDAIAEFKKKNLDTSIYKKFNFITYTTLNKSTNVQQCDPANDKLQQCWDRNIAKNLMRFCEGDGYVILIDTPKASENLSLAEQILKKWGGNVASTWGLGNGESAVLRYDLSAIQTVLTRAITSAVQSDTMEDWNTALQKFK